MRRGDPDDDELQEGEEPDDEGDDEGEELEEDGELDPEDRSVEPPIENSTPTPARFAVVGDAPIAAESVTARAVRPRVAGATWLPLSDPSVGYVLVYRAGSGGSYLARLVRPFPTIPIPEWLHRTYGPGRYRLLERGHPPAREYIGSLTLTAATDIQNGNGHGVGGEPAPAPLMRAPEIPPGTDYRLALVTVGLPILAGVLGKFAEAMVARPQRSELADLMAFAKFTQVPNEERASAFRDGMKLAKELAAESPAQREDAGSLFNTRDLLAGVGDIVRAWSEGRARAAQAAAQNPQPGPAPAAAAPAARAPAAELQAQHGETADQFVGRVLVTEIKRAVESGDTPECLVILLDAWLPQVVAWIEVSSDDQVLELLPQRFPEHAEFLGQEQVQIFLRGALKMVREDNAEEASDVRGAHEHSAQS